MAVYITGEALYLRAIIIDQQFDGDGVSEQCIFSTNPLFNLSCAKLGMMAVTEINCLKNYLYILRDIYKSREIYHYFPFPFFPIAQTHQWQYPCTMAT